MWRSQLSRNPMAACGGRSQRSSRIAAAACARRAPCEPFEAAPSFLCHGDVAARQVRAVPTNCKFHALRQAEASQQLRAIAAVAMSCRFWAGRRCRLDRRRVGLTKAPAEQGKGLGGKTDGRSTTEEREGGETRAREAQSKRGRAVAAATDPSRPVRSRRNISARAGSGLHLAVFCVPHFTPAAAAETLPQRNEQTTHSYS